LSANLTREEFQELTRLQPTRWLRDVALDWGLIAFAFWVFDAMGHPWILLPLFAIFIGCRQHGLVLLFHDASHRVALPNRKWNDRLGHWLAGWCNFAVMDHGYREWHMVHHRKLGSEEDPELGYRGHAPYAGPISVGHIARYFVTDLAALGIPGMLAFFREVTPRNPLRFLGPVGMFLSLFLVCWNLDAMWVFWLWTWSLVAGHWPVFRIRTWSEHVGLERGGREGSHRIHAGPVTRFLFFPHNTYCHYEHHLSPQVPYHNLPKMREMLVAKEGGEGRPVLSLRELLSQFEGYDGEVPSGWLSESRG
jgi:fatty acid desaturase